jgi:hypothetical protein
MPSKTIRLTEIAELLGVTHQRTSVIVLSRGSPIRSAAGTEPHLGSARGRGVGEGLAAREAPAVAAPVEAPD